MQVDSVSEYHPLTAAHIATAGFICYFITSSGQEMHLPMATGMAAPPF